MEITEKYVCYSVNHSETAGEANKALLEQICKQLPHGMMLSGCIMSNVLY